MLNASENSNQCPPTLENLSNDEPQVLWVGIVICVLSLILLLPRLGSVISALNSHFGLLFIYEAPIIGGLLIFLSIGAYMISCSVRKKVANPPIKTSFTKAKSAALLFAARLWSHPNCRCR